MRDLEHNYQYETPALEIRFPHETQLIAIIYDRLLITHRSNFEEGKFVRKIIGTPVKSIMIYRRSRNKPVVDVLKKNDHLRDTERKVRRKILKRLVEAKRECESNNTLLLPRREKEAS